MTSCPEDEVLGIVADGHNVIFVLDRFNCRFGINYGPVTVSLNSNNISGLVLFMARISAHISPDTDASVPPNCCELDALVLNSFVLVA